MSAGISREVKSNNFVFIGKLMNIAIANHAKSSENIEVSLSVYNNLEDNV